MAFFKGITPRDMGWGLTLERRFGIPNDPLEESENWSCSPITVGWCAAGTNEMWSLRPIRFLQVSRNSFWVKKKKKDPNLFIMHPAEMSKEMGKNEASVFMAQTSYLCSGAWTAAPRFSSKLWRFHLSQVRGQFLYSLHISQQKGCVFTLHGRDACSRSRLEVQVAWKWTSNLTRSLLFMTFASTWSVGSCVWIWNHFSWLSTVTIFRSSKKKK